MKRNIFFVLLHTFRKTATVLIFTFGLVILFIFKTNASGAEFLVKNGNNYDLNLLKFKQIEYVGQCPGTVISPSTINAQFSSKSTPPAAKRRVIIKNVTRGMDTNPYPYTDRSYQEGEYSELFDFSVGNKHKTRSFAVLGGENKFAYEIKEGEKIIEQGAFTAQVSIQDVGTFPREAICTEELTCNEEYSSKCDESDKSSRRRRIPKRCYPTRRCSCPS